MVCLKPGQGVCWNLYTNCTVFYLSSTSCPQAFGKWEDKCSKRIEQVSKSDHLDLFHPQVLRESTGRTYWVRWHILEIVGFGNQWEDPAAQEKEYSVTKCFNVDTGEVVMHVYIISFFLIILWDRSGDLYMAKHIVVAGWI